MDMNNRYAAANTWLIGKNEEKCESIGGSKQAVYKYNTYFASGNIVASTSYEELLSYLEVKDYIFPTLKNGKVFHLTTDFTG